MTEQDIRKGLNGVVADYTAVSKVNPETNSLLYRGYPVQELAEHCTFEEVAYLLWNGELPNDEQLAEFRGGCMENRDIGEELIQVINFMPKDCHPMDVLRTAVSYLGAEDPEKFTPGLRPPARHRPQVAGQAAHDRGHGHPPPPGQGLHRPGQGKGLLRELPLDGLRRRREVPGQHPVRHRGV